jgi:hypothetical protein
MLSRDGRFLLDLGYPAAPWQILAGSWMHWRAMASSCWILDILSSGGGFLPESTVFVRCASRPARILTTTGMAQDILEKYQEG